MQAKLFFENFIADYHFAKTQGVGSYCLLWKSLLFLRGKEGTHTVKRVQIACRDHISNGSGRCYGGRNSLIQAASKQ